VYYLVGNLQDAQDAVQEAFLRCWKRRGQLPEVRNLKAWIFQITLNIARDIRKAAWNQRKKSLSNDIAFMPAKGNTPDEIVSEDEQLQLLRERIAGLDEPDKEVFLLRQNGDLTYPQIAELLAIPEGTVKTRMRRAIKQMRNDK
jgi:RNA polymerase sigma-70 factor (ECF subfamily)